MGRKKKKQKLNIKTYNIKYLILALLIILIVFITCERIYILNFFSSSGLVGNVLGVRTSQNLIQLENALPGTTDWQMTNVAPHGEIQAYVGKDSVNKGEHELLYVSVKEPNDRYTYSLYRLGYYGGKGGRFEWRSTYRTALQQGYYDQSENAAYPICPTGGTCQFITSLKDSKGNETYISDANWRNPLAIPTNTLLSGIYLVKVTETHHGYQWEAPFIVRDDSRKADLVLQYPFNTDQAYNYWGGTSLYINYRLCPSTGKCSTNPYWAFIASYNRPYTVRGGVGFLFNWGYPMARFLEQQGYDVTYTTNNAVALGQTNLTNYKGFISMGHDEYWSLSERNKLDLGIAKGLNVGFFGGNSMYWQIRNLPDSNNQQNRYIVEYKDAINPTPYDPYDVASNPLQYLTTTQWRATPVNNPENKTIKEEWIYGTGNTSLQQDFVVKNASNWIYNGTGLQDGDKIPSILGVEADTFVDDINISPEDKITIIGDSPFIGYGNKVFTTNAIIDILPTGNIIFNAGAMNWSTALTNFRVTKNTPESKALEIMTNNVLQRMIGNTSFTGGSSGLKNNVFTGNPLVPSFQPGDFFEEQE